MLSTIARLVNPRKRRDVAAPSSKRSSSVPKAVIDDDAERCVARSLADALDEALHNKHAHQVQILTAAAARIAARHPILTERLARMRLTDGDAEAALSLIDASLSRTASLRLLRNACLILVGRRAEAHQDLCEWSHHSVAPIDARLMLALLDWEHGDIDSANTVLRENLRQLKTGDEHSLIVSLCIAAEMKHTTRTRELALQLRQCTAGRTCTPDVDVLMATIGITPPMPATNLSNPQVDAFVTELIAAEDTITALVESLELKPDRTISAMLVEAVARALPDLSNESAGIAALARLHLQLGERDEALTLIEGGLASNPMSAALVLMRQELSDHDRAGTSTQDERSSGHTIETRDQQRSKAA